MSLITLQEMVSVPMVKIHFVMWKLFCYKTDIGCQAGTHMNILRDVNAGSETKQFFDIFKSH